MYQKFHLQLTLFSTFFTGLILVFVTMVCLSISEQELEKSHYISFLNNVNSTFTHMENQTVISHQWLSRLEANHQFLIQLYDEGHPLYYQTLKRSKTENEQISKAVIQAKTEYNLDIFSAPSSRTLLKHQEFTMKENGKKFYVSAAILPVKNSYLGVLILSTTDRVKKEIQKQRMLFALADSTSILALFFFSWLFTGKMIQPLEESRTRQTQFISAASHELRAPLSVILSSLSALKKAPKADAERFIQMIHSEGSRMSRLIDDMLLLANSDSKSWQFIMEPVELDTLLLDIYEKYENMAAAKKIRLQIQLPEEYLPMCHCDAQRITQVLSVLLDNALHYTPAGGCILLSLETKGKYVVFCIADEGPGIPAKEKKKIFERFYRTEASRTDKEHFGLGLCIANEIIKAHRGTIWVEDHHPVGAAFYFTLPLG